MTDRQRAPSFTINRADPQAFLARKDEIVAVYRAAFEPPPYRKGDDEVQAFAGSLAGQVARPGFRAVLALERGRAGAPVGFAFGHVGQPGQWWYDVVARALSPQERVQWLGDVFELVELAVAPPAQGRGVGGRLHDALLAGVQRRTAVLSTMHGETAARHLYDGRGWVLLLDSMSFPSARRPYAIMGKVLGDRA